MSFVNGLIINEYAHLFEMEKWRNGYFKEESIIIIRAIEQINSVHGTRFIK